MQRGHHLTYPTRPCHPLTLDALASLPTLPTQPYRGHTREAYDSLVQRARDTIPRVALSTDVICGESTRHHHGSCDQLIRVTGRVHGYHLWYAA